MASNKPFRFGPIALTATIATDLLNPGSTSGGVNDGSFNLYILLKHVRILNKTGAPVAFSLYIGASGATAAGTEFMGTAAPVPGNGSVDFYSPGVRLDTADFLVGGAAAGASLVIMGEGEIGVA